MLERGVGTGLVTNFPVVDDVVELVFLVIADYRRAVSHGLKGIHYDRQRLVLDVDHLAGVLGDIRVVGNYAGDFLALEPDLVGREYGLNVIGQRRQPGQVPGLYQLAGHHQVDTGNLPRPARVDRLDPRMGQRTAQYLHVQHAGQRDVIGVVTLASDEPVVFYPLAAGPDSADLDFV